MWEFFCAVLQVVLPLHNNLARTIFFSLWNGVPRIWNSSGSCVFAYQTGKLSESYHQSTAAFVSVHVFIHDQRDRTHDAHSTVICLFSYLAASLCLTELSAPQKTMTTLWIMTCKHVSREIEHCLISDFGDYQYIPRRRQWHPTPVLLPGKSHGRRSLEGCSPWGC